MIFKGLSRGRNSYLGSESNVSKNFPNEICEFRLKFIRPGIETLKESVLYYILFAFRINEINMKK